MKFAHYILVAVALLALIGGYAVKTYWIPTDTKYIGQFTYQDPVSRDIDTFTVTDLTTADAGIRLVEVNEVSLGAFQPAAGGTYRLQTSIGSTDTSIRLASFEEPISDLPITMTSLTSDIGYGTVDPQSSTRKEFVSFTGITQNSDGTATLTGVTRGLAFLYPFTASTTLRQAHPGQSIFILSDSPQLFDEYTKRRNNEWITGTWGFNLAPTTTDTCNSAAELCNKTYVDSLSIAGAPTSTEDTLGIVELATHLEMGSSTASSTEGRPLVLLSRYATTTPTASGCSSGPCVVGSYFQGLSASWISSTIEYVFGNFVATNATTTNATTTNLALIKAGVNGGLLKTTSTGIVTKASTSTDYQAQKLVAINRTDVNPGAGAFATSTETMFISGGTLTSSSTIEVQGAGSIAEAGGSVYLRLSDGTTIANVGLGAPGTGRTWGVRFKMLVAMNTAVTAQEFVGYSDNMEEGTVSAIRAGDNIDSEGTSAIDFSQDQTIVLVVQGSGAGDPNIAQHYIIVEP